MVTYDDALAACTARWGEPSDVYAVSACARAWWTGALGGDDGVLLAETDAGGVALAAPVGADAAARWTLAGEPTPGSPAATLPDALDAAEAWLRGARSAREVASARQSCALPLVALGLSRAPFLIVRGPLCDAGAARAPGHEVLVVEARVRRRRRRPADLAETHLTRHPLTLRPDSVTPLWRVPHRDAHAPGCGGIWRPHGTPRGHRP